MEEQFQLLAKDHIRALLKIEKILDVIWHRRHDQNVTIKQLKAILTSTKLNLTEASKKELLAEFGEE